MRQTRVNLEARLLNIAAMKTGDQLSAERDSVMAELMNGRLDPYEAANLRSAIDKRAIELLDALFDRRREP